MKLPSGILADRLFLTLMGDNFVPFPSSIKASLIPPATVA
jgi:hypothetical protein